MDIKAILKNIKKHGLKETYQIHKTKKMIDQMIHDRSCVNMNDEDEYSAFMDRYAAWESDIKKNSPMVWKNYFRQLKSYYIKELIPAVYAEHAVKPVQDKLIFMENGNSPSPSSSLMVKTLRKEGKYEVHTIGLHIRAVSEKEYFENAVAFIKDAADAKAVFLSTANDLLSHFDLREETKLIQLWHGCGAFKKVGYSTIGKSFGKDQKARDEYPSYRNYSYVTIAAEAQSWVFEDAMRIKKEDGIIVPVGVSRTDLFYNQEYIDNAYSKLYDKLPQTKGKKIILYAPTFRGAVAKAKAPDQLDVNAFAESLSDEYVLLIKHHGLSKDIPPIPEQWKDTFAFDMNKMNILGIDELLAISDICITDYSSIGFEYSLMERPLIFFAYDLDDYLDARGMYYDYEDITPGPIFKENEPMVDYIKHIDERFDKQAVIDFKNLHMAACDGHSTERTIALIES